MREPRLCSSPSIFHPSTNRRMYRFASNGEMGEPCGMPRRLFRASAVRVFLPRSSVSSTGQSSHILIRCSTRRSTIRRVTDFTNSAWGMLPSVDALPGDLRVLGPVWDQPPAQHAEHAVPASWMKPDNGLVLADQEHTPGSFLPITCWAQIRWRSGNPQ